MLLPSILGWANALTAAVWWLLPDFAQFAPMLNLALNGFSTVWVFVSSDWSATPFSVTWKVHIFAWVACALDIFTLLTMFVFEDDMADDDWEDEGDSWETSCDVYDYYCY